MKSKWKSIKKNKYGAIKTVVDGITFDSKYESERWKELCLLACAGYISNLKNQVPYVLHAAGKNGQQIKVGTYKADFVYETKSGCTVVEDTKGVETAMFKWKKKHFDIEYSPLSITVIKKK